MYTAKCMHHNKQYKIHTHYVFSRITYVDYLHTYMFFPNRLPFLLDEVGFFPFT